MFGHFFGQSSFARHAIATEHNAVKVDADLPLAPLGPLACGVQTGAGAVWNSLNPAAGTGIAIFAAGSVGLSAVMAAAVAGCDPLVAVDIQADRLALAAELGATHVLNSKDTDVVAAVVDLTSGRGVHYSLDCIGLPDVLAQALSCLQSPGVCATVGVSGRQQSCHD